MRSLICFLCYIFSAVLDMLFIFLSLFDAEVSIMRNEYRIFGALVGSLPSHPQQNIAFSLPVSLLPEEAAILLEIGARMAWTTFMCVFLILSYRRGRVVRWHAKLRKTVQWAGWATAAAQSCCCYAEITTTFRGVFQAWCERRNEWRRFAPLSNVCTSVQC